MGVTPVFFPILPVALHLGQIFPVAPGARMMLSQLRHARFQQLAALIAPVPQAALLNPKQRY
jgi:hypothetical protein